MTILVADDFAAWRSKIRELVDHAVQIVGEACDGVDVVEKAIRLRPDIVILDIGLPHINGLDAAAMIRRHCSSTAIVFLSANTDASIHHAALNIGHAFILKSEATRKLLPAIYSAYAAAASDEAPGSISSRN